MPLDVKPSTPREKEKRLKKRARRPNQLCLTPRTVKHKFSEEFNDADEAAKLAVAAASFPTAER